MPKLLAVPVGVKSVAIVASAFAHVAIAAASLVAGHATPTLAYVDVQGDEVQIEPVVEPPPEPAKPDDDDDDDHPHVTPHASPVAPHPHTHDYPVLPSHDTTPHDPNLVHAPFSPAAPAAPKSDAPAEEPAPVVTAPALAPLRITITVGNGGGPTSTAGGSGAATTPSAPPAAPEIVPEASVSTPARAISSVRPAYPPSARAAEIEADVALEIVVDASGAVVSARTTRTVGYGLDDAALNAIRLFRFSPAQRNGHAIGVRMRWVMQFRLQ